MLLFLFSIIPYYLVQTYHGCNDDNGSITRTKTKQKEEESLMETQMRLLDELAMMIRHMQKPRYSSACYETMQSVLNEAQVLLNAL